MCQATKLVTMKASSFQALGVGAKVVEEVCLLKRNPLDKSSWPDAWDCFGEWASPLPLRLLAQRVQGRGGRGAGRRRAAAGFAHPLNK